MKNNQRKMKNILLPALIVLLMTGCRKDLCYNHDEHGTDIRADVKATWECEWERSDDFDWEIHWPDCSCGYDELRPEVANGIRAVIYDTEGTAYTERNLKSEGGILPMTEGMHSILFYNNDTEYIVFEDLPSSATATATTRTRTRSTFANTEAHDGERTVNEPDMLFGHYIEEHDAQRTAEPTALPITMHPLVYTYMVRYEFSHGLEYVALARGGMAGMAESVYLQDGHTGETTATVLYDCVLTEYGTEAHVQTFGIPNYPGDGYTRADQTYTLNLEVCLKNGKLLNYNFDITNQLEDQPRGGVITVTGIEVSDKDGTEGGSGFNPDIDGWGEYEDIPMPIL